MISLRSKVTKGILNYYFLHENESFYVNEISRILDLDSGNVTRKLNELESVGLLKSELIGNQKYFSLNKKYPFINEYRAIVRKTIGLESLLVSALDNVEGVKAAILYGSYVQENMDQFSDLDMIIIGRQNTIEAQKKMNALQKKIGREINCRNMSSREFEEKKKKDPFLKSVLRMKHKVVYGQI